MNYDRNDPTAEENRAPKFCVGDRVRTVRFGPELTVLAVHGDRAWCAHPRSGALTFNFGELTLVPDTVLVEMPRKVRDAYAKCEPLDTHTNFAQVVVACRKSKEQDQ